MMDSSNLVFLFLLLIGLDVCRSLYRMVWPTVSISMLGVLILHHSMMSVWVKVLCLHSLMMVLFLFPTEEGVWVSTVARVVLL
jgi:hypothetical protein